MIPVTVSHLSLSNVGFVVLLQSMRDERALPIFVGVGEAQAIALPLSNVQTPRPMTHDLLKSMLELLECRVDRVEVCDIQDGTFFSRILIHSEGHQVAVDARPSDAVALALRCKVPVFVAESVMDSAGVILKNDEVQKASAPIAPASPGTADDPLSLLRNRLATAIAEERYEEAAHLRDEIRRTGH